MNALRVGFWRRMAVSALFLAGMTAAEAREIGGDEAARAVVRWAGKSEAPLGARGIAGHAVERVDTARDGEGRALYHAVHLDGGAVVVASAESGVVPIVAFSDGAADDGKDNPLWDILSRDLRDRLAGVDRVRTGRKKATPPENAVAGNEAAWARLLSDRQARDERVALLSDVRVPPLLVTSWSQETVNGMYVYNYYTPNHYPCGCVATAMAQVMRHHAHPKAAVASFSGECRVDGVETVMWTLGGAFDWNNMPGNPAGTILTEVQCQAIGKLCHDIGVSIDMSYTLPGSSSTGRKAVEALGGVWGFASAFYYSPAQLYYPSDDELQNTVFANCDAGYPVLLSIREHEVVGDGYGYSGSTPYTHINLGWGGMGDGYWYNLPTVNVPENNGYWSSEVESIGYNIFPDRTGVLITGRVLDAAGMPVAGATVTGKKGSVQVSDTTDARGIYALLVPGAGTYSVGAAYGGQSSGTASVKVSDCESSFSSRGVVGNSWGNDLVLGGEGVQRVKFDTNGGTCGTTVGNYEIGGKYGWLPTATLAGETFLGWYTEKTGGERVTEESPVTAEANRTLYAHWSETGAVNLAFYVPAGWSSAFFATTDAEGTEGMTAFKSGTGIRARYGYRNTGGAPAGAFTVRIAVKDTGGAVVWECEDTVSGMASHASSYGGRYIDKTLPSGTYTMEMVLDSGKTVAESDEDDNTARVTFTVGTVPVQKPDLEFYVPGGGSAAVFASASATGTSSATSFREGDAVYVRFAYRNSGTASAGVFAIHGVVRDGSGTVVYNWDETSAGVGSGIQTAGVHHIAEALVSGTYTVEIELDSGKAVAEGNESNNTGWTTFTVEGAMPVQKPNLEFCIPSGWPASVFAATTGTGTAEATSFQPGDAVYVRYAYRNGGGAAAGAFVASGTVEDSGGTVVYRWEDSSTGLGAGAQTAGGHHVDKALPSGTYTVKVVLDSGKAVAESNENDNSGQTSFTVAVTPPGRKPNLEFYVPDGWSAAVFATASSMESTAVSTFRTGDPIHLRTAYKNGGSEVAGAFAIRWTVKNNSGGATVYQWESSHESLEPDVLVQAALPLDKTLPEGTYTLTVELDSGKAVDESDEYDNLATATFAVEEPKMPNLAFRQPGGWPKAMYLTATEGSTVAATVFPRGSIVYLYFAYENSGNAAAGQHLAGISVKDSQGDEVKGWGKVCPGLAAGQGTTVEDKGLMLDWDDDYDYSMLGTYTVTVTLDSGKAVSERNEGDNTMSLTFTVEPANQTVTFDANGGSCAVASKEYPIGEKYGELPVAEKRGCTFEGWYTEDEGGLRVTEGWRVTADRERTLHARWTPYADLSFWAPEGWPAPVFFSMEKDGTTATTNFTQGDVLHFNMAYVNSGAAAAGPHVYELRLLDASGVKVAESSWREQTGIAAFTCHPHTSFWFLAPAPGRYTAEVELDTGGELAENDESNNLYRVSFTVVSAEDEKPRVTGFEVDAGTKTVSLRFTAEAGKTYALRRVRNLGGSEGDGAGEWNTVKRVTATESGELSVLVDDGDFDSLSRAFYCLEEQQ